MDDFDKLKKVLAEAVIYCPQGSDRDITIEDWDDEFEMLYGSDSDGNEYEIPFDEIDLKADNFFMYVKVDVDNIV